ncbi:MAG: 2-oxoacid:acceptor oxidoreductase family protein [Candidatus Eisenbacteria bacterium]|nr:2-oxoacid:acceptor oxidoreductase family protein [Candidatus Eisenbacteria bacterium]
MARTELRFAGFGGQGILLAGYIVGKAASIYDKKHATFTQSYGPESRGGACAAGVVVSETPVHYPHPVKPAVLVVMSQEACVKFEPGMPDNGVMLIDEDLVTPQRMNKTVKVYAIHSTRMAEELGRKIVANIVMLGFFAGVTKIVSHDSMKTAILEAVPAATKDLNENAFEQGYEYGLKAQPLP